MNQPVLNYRTPQDSARPNRLALFAFVWSLVSPAAGFGLVISVGDTLDDLFERPTLVWIFAAGIMAAPLLAATLGGMCLGALRATGGGSRLDRNYAIAAIVLGWAQVVALAVLLAAGWRA